MGQRVAKLRFAKRIQAAIAVITVLAITAVGVGIYQLQSAKAATVVDVNTVELDFSTAKRTATSTPTAVNGTATYTNVATVGGVQIDAVVTTVALSNATITGYDAIGGASSNDKYFQIDNNATVIGGFTSFRFDFYDHADGSVATLKNVSVTSIDLDSPGRQFTEFNGFQNYVLSSTTKLTAYTTNQSGVALGNGLVRFIQTRTNSAVSGSNEPSAAVEIRFAQMSSYTAVFGNEMIQGGYFGVAFKGLCATTTGTADGTCATSAPVTNPNNSPPTTSSTTRYYDLSVPAVLTLDNFPYADSDSNAFASIRIDSLPGSGSLQYFNGTTWVTAPTGSSIPVADIQLGYLRYSGTGSSFTYRVNDGTLFSSSSSTVTVVGAPNGQVITFVNPGNKVPTAPTFASNATADSGLTVTLTSLTPSVCVVSGLTIDPVGSGACTIVASQAGNSSYGAATSVTQTFYITTDAAQTITFANPGDKTWSGSSFTIPTTPTASSGLTVSLTSSSPSVCTVSGSTITIVGPGTCQIRATQAGGLSGGTTYASAPPVTISFVVSTPIVYTVTYSANTSTSGTVPAATTGNGEVTLRSNSGTLAKTGYTLTGWNTLANGTGTHYAVGATYALGADVTLYAEWTPVTYTITYSGNTSTSGTTPADTTRLDSGDVTLQTNSGTLDKTGYTFTGWNTLANGTGTHYAVGATFALSTNLVLYAEWTPVVYTVTYSANTSTSGTVPAVTTGNGEVTLRSNSGTLAKTGFTFTGWNTLANGTGTHYAVEATYALGADVTLYAQWTEVSPEAPTTYTITYAGNTPTSGTAPADTTGNGEVTLRTNSGTLTKTGYTFTGWNTLADGTGDHHAVGGAYTLTADATLYAEWTPVIYTIIYAGNTSTTGTAPADTTGNGEVTLRTNSGTLTKTGYTFTGWNTLADGTGDHLVAGATYGLSANIVLYAEWTPVVYTISYAGNSSTSGTVPADTTGNGEVTLRSNSGTLAKTGYTFTGWNTRADGTGDHHASGGTYTLAADVTLYADWALVSAPPATYTITYSDNGSTGGAAPAATTGNGTVSLQTNSGGLLKTGSTFTGWNTRADGAGDHFAPGASFVLSEDHTLYAEWKVVVDFSGNGAVSGAEPPAVNADGTITIPDNVFDLSKPGFVFVGWNSRADGTGIHYSPGDLVLLTSDVTLFAQWEPANLATALAQTGANVDLIAPVGGVALILGLVLAALRPKRRRKH